VIKAVEAGGKGKTFSKKAKYFEVGEYRFFE
jgi:hypothetical protein